MTALTENNGNQSPKLEQIIACLRTFDSDRQQQHDAIYRDIEVLQFDKARAEQMVSFLVKSNEDLTQQIGDVEREKELQNRKVQQLEAEAERMRLIKSSYDLLQTEFDQLRNRNLLLEKELDSERKKVSDLRKGRNVMELETKRLISTREYTQNSSNMEPVRDDQSVLMRQIDELKKEMGAMKSANVELQQQNQGLLSQVSDLEQTVEMKIDAAANCIAQGFNGEAATPSESQVPTRCLPEPNWQQHPNYASYPADGFQHAAAHHIGYNGQNPQQYGPSRPGNFQQSATEQSVHGRAVRSTMPPVAQAAGNGQTHGYCMKHPLMSAPKVAALRMMMQEKQGSRQGA